MAPSKTSTRSIRTLFYTMLGTPVLVCIGAGVIYGLSDLKQGLFLVGIGLVVGAINLVVIKVLLRKLEESENEESEPQEHENP
jgi:hypothetical protein